MQNITRILSTLTLSIGLAGSALGQGQADFDLIETSPQEWMLFGTVTGDTSGLFAVHINVFGTEAEIASMGTDAATLEPLGGLDTATGEITGFASLAQIPVGNPALQYNAGSTQDFDTPLFDIGIIPVSVPTMLPQPVNTAVPTKLLTIVTPVDLTQPGAVEVSVFLYDDTRTFNGFLDDNEIDMTLIVTPIPEPVSAVLLSVTGVALIARRRS